MLLKLRFRVNSNPTLSASFKRLSWPSNQFAIARVGRAINASKICMRPRRRAEEVLDVVPPADHQPDEGDGANVLAHNAAFYAELPVEPPETAGTAGTGRNRENLVFDPECS